MPMKKPKPLDTFTTPAQKPNVQERLAELEAEMKAAVEADPRYETWKEHLCIPLEIDRQFDSARRLIHVIRLKAHQYFPEPKNGFVKSTTVERIYTFAVVTKHKKDQYNTEVALRDETSAVKSGLEKVLGEQKKDIHLGVAKRAVRNESSVKGTYVVSINQIVGTEAELSDIMAAIREVRKAHEP